MKRLVLLLTLVPFTFAQDTRGPISKGLPPWIDLGIQSRFRAEGQHGLNFEPGVNDDFFLQRYRFSAGLRPTSWLQFFGEVQDARVSGVSHPDAGLRDTFDIRQALVGIGHESGWWDVKAGRQRIAFGSERVIGAADWGNTARVFDAVRLGIHHGSNRVDIFSSAVVNNDTDRWDHHLQGNNLHGAYASLGSLLPNLHFEPYLLVRTNHLSGLRTYTTGLRTTGTARKSWAYEVEALKQTGDLGVNNVSAWGLTLQLQRKLSLPWQPTLMGEYNYATGDRNPNDHTVQTLDQLYPTNHGFYGVADQIGRRNTENVRGTFSIQPAKRLSLRAEGHSFWLANRNDGLYAFNGVMTVKPVPGGALDTGVGRELDLIADWKASKYYVVGAQFGHLFPGKFLNTYTKGSGRTFYAVFVDFRVN